MLCRLRCLYHNSLVNNFPHISNLQRLSASVLEGRTVFTSVVVLILVDIYIWWWWYIFLTLLLPVPSLYLRPSQKTSCTHNLIYIRRGDFLDFRVNCSHNGSYLHLFIFLRSIKFTSIQCSKYGFSITRTPPLLYLQCWSSSNYHYYPFFVMFKGRLSRNHNSARVKGGKQREGVKGKGRPVSCVTRTASCSP